MKLRKICALALAASLIVSSALAATPKEPKVRASNTNISFNDGINDDLINQAKGANAKPDATYNLYNIQDSDLASFVTAFPDVMKLEISSKELTNIAPLSKLVKLEKLIIRADKVSDIVPLGELTKLTDLTLESKNITDITPIAKLQALTQISLTLEKVTDMTPVGTIAGLKRINAKMGASDLKWMSKLTNLLNISINGENVTSIEGLPNLPTIREISLRYIKPTNLEPILALPGLTKLGLNYADLTKTDLTALAKLTKLANIDLYGAKIKDFSPLAACPALKELMYYATKGSDYSTLGKITQIEILKGGLTDLKDISWVSTLPNLKKFDVFAEYVTDYTPLTNCKKLEYFQIWSMRVPLDMTSLSKVTWLKTLKVWSMDGVINLSAIGNMTGLEHLILQDVNSKGGDPINVADFAKLPNLKKLDLSSSKRVTGFDKLTAPLLTDLTLDKNISDEQLKGLPQTIKVRKY